MWSGKATVAVLGPGGVGGLLAALLSRAGHRVICLGGPRTVDALGESGIRVRSNQFGNFTARVEAATVLSESVDLCLVTVKHTALDAALDRVPPERLRDGRILPLLNGIEHIDLLRARYGVGQVVPAIIRVESTRTTPGTIEHNSPFVEIDMAAAVPEDLAPLAAQLIAAGVNTRVMPDEHAVLWDKLALLAPLALLTTRYRIPFGGIRSERLPELRTLVEEIATVSRAHGATVEAADVLARYEIFPANTKSSMQRDAEAGRPTELDAIGGAIVRAADRRGLPVPLTRQLVEELAQRPNHAGA
ncbi:ketopantoate reductase family protein [Nocardia arthritidis]|uniref:2-dehydropantoate 2-reductase n=1 Tax=Nocardia arthritidis TaxID=228602 RepID=A0A6G9YI53_9NOCA|nr:2-dehydropantoate 2-reductase [Nocardia arthritidis]QIS12716.1 2-dehydropantoate 2-reductase [Nocardia arthritidis]